MRVSTLLTTFLLAGCASQTPGLESLPARDLQECRASDLETIRSVERTNVAIAIDTSRSTAAPSGSDIDADGRLGKVEKSDVTDPGDSLLAAEVAGVKSLLRATAGLDIRYSIVTFSGPNRYPPQHPPEGLVLKDDAMTQAELTRDLEQLEAALARVLERGSAGSTNFAAGMRLAIRSLTKTSPAGFRRRLVLFLSDSPTPLVQAGPGHEIAREDPFMAYAAKDAVEARVVFHTFGLGAVAAVAPPHPLSRIAGATGGTYRVVEDPADLHCHLLEALLP